MSAQATVEQATQIKTLSEMLFSGELPSQAEYIRSLEVTDALQAVVLLAMGIVYLMYGWRYFKVLVVINAAILGTFLGYQLGALLGGNMPWFGAVAGCVLLAILAWPAMRYAISLMGGIAGAVVGYGAWQYSAAASGKEVLLDYAWVGGVMGLVGMGLLAFVVLRMTVMIFTAVQGSAMTVSAFLTLLFKYEGLRHSIGDTIRNNAHLMALIIAVPAAIGFAFQYAAVAKKELRKKKASASGGQ